MRTSNKIDEMEQENSYFRNVVKEAVYSLKRNMTAYVFSQEQVDCVKKMIDFDIEIDFDGIIYNITKVKK